ncbi:hypothetical protein [Nonomuraea sp. NPDC049141]|uniref:hypothetical protein n=1 Tax=Nonomuraea sp. NPDC049141 TaxID=3155500 RepID=UPI0033E5C3E5
MPLYGATTIASTGQSVWIGLVWAGRAITIWADQRSIHPSVDGRHLKTLASRLSTDHLHQLSMRGARPAGPPPAPPALTRTSGHQVVPVGQPVEVQRNVRGNGFITVADATFQVRRDHAGQSLTVRLDGHLMHAISQGTLVATWPYPIPADRLPAMRDAQRRPLHCRRDPPECSAG